jgi:Lon protease-like protein
MAAPDLIVPIFPLPDVTFFPHTLLPLHVFEARYRSMVADCLRRDRRLAVAGLRPGYEAQYQGRPPVHAVAGAGEIVRCERLATGRFNILVRGDCRVRIEREMLGDTLYRIAEATVLADVGAESTTVVALMAEVKTRYRRLLRAVNRAGRGAEEALAAAASAGAFSDQVASTAIPSPALRQALLAEVDVERRLNLLVTTLDDLLTRLSEER